MIITPDIAKLSFKGNILWHIVPPPPVKLKENGKRENIWDLNPVGTCLLWKVMSLEEGCVCFGTGNKDDGGFIFIIRLSTDGKVIWQDSYKPIIAGCTHIRIKLNPI